jgi:hypothetical protein
MSIFSLSEYSSSSQMGFGSFYASGTDGCNVATSVVEISNKSEMEFRISANPGLPSDSNPSMASIN